MATLSAAATTPHPVFRPGTTALITGAASGIGLSIAKLCASHGMSLILLDLNHSALTTACSPSNLGLPDPPPPSHFITHIEADVGNLKHWEERVLTALDTFGAKSLDLVVLNAGVGLPSGWESTPERKVLDAWHTTFTTNIFGVVNGITTLLPFLRQESRDTPPHPDTDSTKNTSSPNTPKTKAIIITGSKQGITNPPSNPAYNSSKAAVKSLAEHLDYDLRETPISVHLLVPGYTYTGMTGAGGEKEEEETKRREKPASAWYPHQVVSYMYDKMSQGKFYIICPDNDVSEEIDRKRILWAVGDLMEGREALSRWREGRKAEFEAFMRG